MRMCILATHPIQYQVPLFRALALQPGVEVRVIYGLVPDPEAQGAGFGVPFTWDLDLCSGYCWTTLPGRGRRSDLESFCGISARGLSKELHAKRPDVVLAMGWNSWMLVWGALSVRVRGLPLLLRGDSNDLTERAAWKRLLQGAFLRRASAFLAVGTANRDFYLKRGIPSEMIFSCPHFVDQEHFELGALDPQLVACSVRERLGIPRKALLALFVGKLQGIKRPSDILAALAQAHDEVPDLWLLIVGDGPLRGELERAASGLPVAFAGFVNQTELPATYAAGDFLVLPSASETWGLVVNEAMTCGLPAIVSSAVGCVQDLVVEDETGWSYPCGDVEALASLLRRAATDRARLKAMGERARKRVTSGYSVERGVEGTLRACEFVLNKSR